MMGPAAGLDRYHRRCKFLEEHYHIFATQLLAQNGLLGGVYPVKQEKVLRRIHANSANMFLNGLPYLRSTTTSFWHNRCRRAPSIPTTQAR